MNYYSRYPYDWNACPHCGRCPCCGKPYNFGPIYHEWRGSWLDWNNQYGGNHWNVSGTGGQGLAGTSNTACSCSSTPKTSGGHGNGAL